MLLLVASGFLRPAEAVSHVSTGLERGVDSKSESRIQESQVRGFP